MVTALSSRRKAAITALVCITPVISHSIGRSVYGLLLRAIRDDFGLTNAQAGYPGSGIFFLYVVGVIAVVFASPRYEPVTIMRAALALSVIGLTVTSLSQGLLPLTVGVSLVGGAGAGIWMTAPVLATEYVSVARRGLVIGMLTSTVGLANILFGVGTSTWRNVADDEQLWRPIWWVALGFALVVLIGFTTIARFSTTEGISTRGVDLSILKGIPEWRQVTVAYALFGGTSAGFMTFIVAAIEEHGGVSESTSPLIFSIMGVCGMLAAPVAGALSDRVGRLSVLKLALAALTAANLLVSAGGVVGTVGGALLGSAGAASIPALIAVHVRDSLDSRSFSQALAIMTIFFSIMAAATPSVAGALADISFRWSYLALAGLPAVALAYLVTSGSRSEPALEPEMRSDSEV